MDKKLEHCKQEYREMKASPELKNKIEKEMRRLNMLKRRRNFATAAACFTLVAAGSITSLNVSPAFASTVSEIPGLQNVVKVLTLHKYEMAENGMEAQVITPKIEGLIDKALQERLNTDFKEYSNTIIAAFEKEMKEMKENFPGEDTHFSIESDYVVKTDTKDILSLDVYMTSIQASASTVHKYYTIDKKTNTLLTLPSLFKENADYIAPISQYLTKEMERQNKAGENFYWIDSEMEEDNFKAIKPEQNFYINKDGNVVICFDEYEVGPGSSGSPEFVIPANIVKGILK